MLALLCNKICMKLIYSKFVSQHSVTLWLAKSGTARNKPYQARRVWNVPETTPSKWNKEKPPSVWAIKDTDRHSMVLESVIFYLR